MKSNSNRENIKTELDLLFNSKTESQLIERDALMLQANYLSEIERIAKESGINRKEIATKIKTSPSYLTQVFRGDKPLNFLTLAKIKRALNLRFNVTAELLSEKKTEIGNVFYPYPLNEYQAKSLQKGLDNENYLSQDNMKVAYVNPEKLPEIYQHQSIQA
jgi:transcriptional regulator with XRE-family HTH domain